MIDVNTPQYWDDVYDAEAKSNLSRMDANRYQMILGHIKENSIVLDFGCGPGDFLKWVRERRPNAILTGVDYSKKAIELAKKSCPSAKWFVSEKIIGKDVDVITIQHVLEHSPNPELFIEQSYNTLKDDGILIIVLPMYDRPWPEHLKIWTLDFLRLFMKQQKKWRWVIIYRPDSGYKHREDGTPSEEALVICQKIPPVA
jgi:2-polyprenyl-3-methyl-5-hydroxy-6-metoxy-1,4-benzoquinol methylase